MQWYDLIITFTLCLVIFFILGSIFNLLLQLTDRQHWFRTAIISVVFSIIAAFVFTI